MLVGEGVLREARLVSETADVKETGKRGRAKSDAARRPTVADFRRFLADRTERGLPELPPEQQPDDFERFLAEEHERQKEREAQEREAQGLGPRRVPAWRRLVCRGVAADDAGSLVEVRVTAAPCNNISGENENGKIEFRAEALRGASLRLPPRQCARAGRAAPSPRGGRAGRPRRRAGSGARGS